MKHLKLYKLEDLPDGWFVYHNTISGYRVNYSFNHALLSLFDTRHNEFYMILSDILPSMLFLFMFLEFLSSNEYNHMDYMQKSLACGFYFAVISCRFCSCIYHIFNCMSYRFNSTLIYIDYIGISNMSIGTYWILLIALQSHIFNIEFFLIYTFIVCCFHSFLLCIFSNVLVSGKINIIIDKIEQPLLCSLAVICNLPAFLITINDEMSYEWRVCCSLSLLYFSFGYIIFYILKIPESWYDVGLCDGKFWNSHILWHIFITNGQFFYLMTTFLELPNKAFVIK